MPFAAATWMNLGIITPSEEVRQRQVSHGIIYMWNLKKWYKQTYYKTEIGSQTQKTNL